MELITDSSRAPVHATRRSLSSSTPTTTIRRRRAVSHEEKRRVVIGLLLDEDWTERSDGFLASIAGVSQPFVSKLRRDLSKKILSVRAPKRRGSDGRLLNTTKIGKRYGGAKQRELILSAMDLGAYTIEELMEESGLSRPALQAVLDDFLRLGAIFTTLRKLNSKVGGRPQLLYMPNPNYQPQK